MSLPDGSPDWLPMLEERLVGAALVSFREHVVMAAGTVTPDDFRDPLLARVWAVVAFEECPCALHVADALAGDQEFERLCGVMGLVEMTRYGSAFIYANEGLVSHAALVRREGERRRAVADIITDANQKVAALNGTLPNNVTSFVTGKSAFA
jgi:hypothetical protein